MKIYHHFVIFIAFVLIFSCDNQKNDFDKYDVSIRKAMLAYKNKNYSKSLSLFEEALDLIPNENCTDYFYAAATALQLKKYDRASKIIERSILNTNSPQEYFESFSEFDEFRDKDIFKEISNKYKSLQVRFYENLNYPEIYKEIDSMIELDQTIRGGDYSIKEKQRVDSININRLIEITKKYGWQNKGWLILWHQRSNYESEDYVWNFFRPYINEQIKKGLIRRDFWAIFEEEKSIIENKKQIYGLYTAQYNQFPIMDINKVDERRDKLGMPPLWYLKEVYGTELPDDYPNKSKKNFN